MYSVFAILKQLGALGAHFVGVKFDLTAGNPAAVKPRGVKTHWTLETQVFQVPHFIYVILALDGAQVRAFSNVNAPFSGLWTDLGHLLSLRPL